MNDIDKLLKQAKKVPLVNSGSVFIYFKPVDLKAPIQYMKEFHTNSLVLEWLIRDFTKLTEEEMVNFRFEKNTLNDLLDDRWGKDNLSYKNAYTIVNAIWVIRACAAFNQAIYKLKNNYEKWENRSRGFSRGSGLSFNSPNWAGSEDEDVINIKNKAIVALSMTRNYRKKYIVDGFEENVIDKVRSNITNTCHWFNIDTRTLGDKASKVITDVVTAIVGFIIFLFIFYCVGKCVTGR